MSNLKLAAELLKRESTVKPIICIQCPPWLGFVCAFCAGASSSILGCELKDDRSQELLDSLHSVRIVILEHPSGLNAVPFKMA